MKKGKAIGIGIIIFVLCSGLAIFCRYLYVQHTYFSRGGSSYVEDTSDVDVSNLEVDTIQAEFIYDTESEEEAVGITDYVFLGEVVSNDGTEYVSSQSGDKFYAIYTNYTVKVLENLKGVLEMDKAIPIKKVGGVTKDRKMVYLFDEDILPEAGKQYVFLAYAQEDGSLLISGPNSNVLQEKKNDEVIEEYEEAVENQVDFERERYTSEYEE